MEKTAVSESNFKRNRKDHYLPRGYLRGFIDPERIDHPQPPWHFDVQSNIWSERSPGEVGYRYGFYDYATHEIHLGNADSDFAQFENTFPRVRQDLILNNFKNWRDHRDFLLRYAQMMRARSLLFFDHKRVEGKNLRAWIVEGVSPDRKSVKLRSMTPEPLPDAFVRNWTIAEMRNEIQKGAAWLNDFNWALRYCDSPATPFIISEIPFISRGRHSDLAAAMQDQDTLLFFPLCWQACLIGSRQLFEIETGRFGEEDMREIRRMYRKTAELFLLAPRQLEFC